MRLAWSLISLILLLFCIGFRAYAQESVWSVAGQQVLRLHATVRGVSPAKRVEALDERLNNILSRLGGKLGAEDIVLRKARGTYSILVHKELLVTVTAEDAAANKTKPELLAKTWLSNLRKTIPQVVPKVNREGA